MANSAALATMEGRITSPAAALKFILAGNAYFTLRSAKTGVRYTYRVRRAESVDSRQARLPLNQKAIADAEEAQRNPLYFVSLLAGQDNTSDYVYLGIIRSGLFMLTRASKMTSSSAPVVAFQWTMTKLRNLSVLPNDLEIWHEGRCGRCGRMLTVPESIAAGIGPDCAGRI